VITAPVVTFPGAQRPPPPLPPAAGLPARSVPTLITTPASMATLVDAAAPAGPASPVSDAISSLEAEDAPPIPGYRIDALLGKGGMGKVYRAVDSQSGRVVAIKTLIPRVPVSFNGYRAFLREISVTRQLSHHNIVQFIDMGKLKGAYYCVLEFVNGPHLHGFVEDNGGRLALAQFAPLMLGILDGLGYAHRTPVTLGVAGRTSVSTGIVHRDLKPENVLLTQEQGQWVPKIADFGLSKSYESAGMTDMTMAGVAGTPTYWPREQITHYRYLHPATDVFSIAAVFYEILTGDLARPGLSQRMEQCHAAGRAMQLPDYIRIIGENTIRPLRSVDPSIPPPVAEVMDRALRETEVPTDETEMRRVLAELRYRDALAFREALAAAFGQCGIDARG
jgi:serine/threonine protein kinase